MPETYGVMVYQEDVIKVAHYFAGLTLAEADVLRRGMSGKYRSRDEFQEVKNKFFRNCEKRGISFTLVNDVWLQIESFAGYAFAKGHSASYAVESYQCLYLKAYFPIEFMVATINNGGGFYSAEFYFQELKKCGALIHGPCVNVSDYSVTVYDKDVYMGFSSINGLTLETIEHIIVARRHFGLFESLRDFLIKVSISVDQLILLIRVGAFRFTGQYKKTLLWDAHFLLSNNKKSTTNITLFKEEPKQFKLPLLQQHELEDFFDELELIGFSIKYSPFKLVVDMPKSSVLAIDFEHNVGSKIMIVGYLVHVKKSKVKTGEQMYFGTFLDENGDWIDTVVFPGVARRFPFTGPGCYFMCGVVMEEFGYLCLDILWQKRLKTKNLEDLESTKLKLPNRYGN